MLRLPNKNDAKHVVRGAAYLGLACLVAVLIWSFRWTVRGPVFEIPRVIAQNVYRQQCPQPTIPVISLYFGLADGSFVQWACLDTVNGNFLLHGTVYVDAPATGQPIDPNIDSALALIPNGGTVAVFLGNASEAIAGTVTISASQTVKCDPATLLVPTGNTVIPFSLKSDGTLNGCTIEPSTTWIGPGVSLTDNYRDGNYTSVSNLTILANGNTACDGIKFSASDVNTQSIAFVTLSHIRIYGCNNAIHLLGQGGFINGNHFQDVEVSWAVYDFRYEDTSSAAGATISRNLCVNCSAESKAGTSISMVYMTGTAASSVSANIFDPIVGWDFSGNVFNLADSAETSNTFFGIWDGTTVDSALSNNFMQVDNMGTISAPITVGNFIKSTQHQFFPNTFSGLGTPSNGVIEYCQDCTMANPCAGAGTGAIAKRLNGIWVCN